MTSRPRAHFPQQQFGVLGAVLDQQHFDLAARVHELGQT
jgi:hypothetical protein